MKPENTHLIVAVLSFLRIFEVSNHSDAERRVTGGLEAEFLHMLSQAMRFTYSIKVPDDLAWGSITKNGSWTGLVGMVQRGEADMALSRMSINEPRMAVIHFSYPYSSEGVSFLKKFPGILSKNTAIIRPFSRNLWIALFILLAMMPVVLRFSLKSKYPLPKLALKVFGCFFNQGTGFRLQFAGDQMLLSSFYMATFVITCSYLSTFLSFLALPLTEKNIRNIEELAAAVESGSVQCSALKGSFTHRQLKESKAEAVRVIGNSFTEDDLIRPGNKEIDTFIRKKNGIFIGPIEAFRTVANHVFISDDNFFSLLYAVVVGKKFPMKRGLDRVIQRIWSSGLYEKSVKTYTSKMRKLAPPVSTDAKHLTVTDLSGPFFALMLGNFIALMTLLAEIAYHKVRKKDMK